MAICRLPQRSPRTTPISRRVYRIGKSLKLLNFPDFPTFLQSKQIAATKRAIRESSRRGANLSELLLLEDIRAQKHQLSALFSVDGYRFSTTYWFDTVDLNALEARFGAEQMQNIYFHIAAFEINRLCSLRPKVVDWGGYSRFVGEDFQNTWLEIFRNVWAQWRFENDDPEYFGPQMKIASSPTPPPPGGKPPN